MSDVWLRDRKARVLGPVSTEVLADLVAAGRVRDVAEVSPDGEEWVAVERFPVVARLLKAQSEAEKAAPDAEKAASLRALLEAAREKPPHQVFELPPDATVEAFRAAFFRLVKRYYPDSLPPEASAELRQASAEMFQYLSDLMTRVEHLTPSRQASAGPPVLQRQAAPPAPAEPEVAGPAHTPAPAQVPRQPKEPGPPSYKLEDFLGITRVNDKKLRACLKLTAQSLQVFSSDPLLNLANGGVFVPFEDPVPLGTAVEVVLNFPESLKEICTRGTIVAWSAGTDRRRRGFSVQLFDLSKDDRGFISDYLRQARSRTPNR
jgi:Tfp pilus assembly protein PilZ